MLLETAVAEVEQKQGQVDRTQAYLRQVAETGYHITLNRALLSIG
jgi:hypothetical protein